MLENVNLKKKLSREAYQKELPDLQRRLYDLEKACWDNKIPSIVIFEGWDAAGKGSAIATLTQRLDPRGFKLHAITLPRTYEQNRPWLWRYWLKVPDRGEMVILDHSWYLRVLRKRVEGVIEEKAWRSAYRDIVDFERMLSDDGTVIIKFFFHISKKEQTKRFRAILKDPLESWQVTKEDWKRRTLYGKYLEATEEMLELTEAEFAPWTIVEATSRYYARRKVVQTIIGRLEEALGKKAPPKAKARQSAKDDSDLRAAMESFEGDV